MHILVRYQLVSAEQSRAQDNSVSQNIYFLSIANSKGTVEQSKHYQNDLTSYQLIGSQLNLNSVQHSSYQRSLDKIGSIGFSWTIEVNKSISMSLGRFLEPYLKGETCHCDTWPSNICLGDSCPSDISPSSMCTDPNF